MLQKIALICSFFCFGLLFLTGCGYGLSPTPTTLSATPINVTPAIIPGTETAPSFQQISADIFHIAQWDVNPDGPELGPDGIVDQQIVSDLDAYTSPLLGKRAVAWQGWLSSYTDSMSGAPNSTFDLTILMTPDRGDNTFGWVLLSGVPREELLHIVPYINLDRGNGTWDEPMPSVEYSGTIASIGDTADIYLDSLDFRQVPAQKQP